MIWFRSIVLNNFPCSSLFDATLLWPKVGKRLSPKEMGFSIYLAPLDLRQHRQATLPMVPGGALCPPRPNRRCLGHSADAHQLQKCKAFQESKSALRGWLRLPLASHRMVSFNIFNAMLRIHPEWWCDIEQYSPL